MTYGKTLPFELFCCGDKDDKKDTGCNAKIYSQRMNRKTQETFKKEGIVKYCPNCRKKTLFKAKECKHSSN